MLEIADYHISVSFWAKCKYLDLLYNQRSVNLKLAIAPNFKNLNQASCQAHKLTPHFYSLMDIPSHSEPFMLLVNILKVACEPRQEFPRVFVLAF